MSEHLRSDVAAIATDLAEQIGAFCSGLYVYGSSAHASTPESDVDVLVIVPAESHSEVFRLIGSIQNRHTRLIHPAVVSAPELAANPLLQALTVNAFPVITPDHRTDGRREGEQQLAADPHSSAR